MFPGLFDGHRGTEGSTARTRSIATRVYLNNISSGNGPTLKYEVAPRSQPGQFDPYVPRLAVEQTAGGYQVALKYAAGNQFSIWNTDSNGNFVSFLPCLRRQPARR